MDESAIGEAVCRLPAGSLGDSHVRPDQVANPRQGVATAPAMLKPYPGFPLITPVKRLPEMHCLQTFDGFNSAITIYVWFTTMLTVLLTSDAKRDLLFF